MLPIAPVSRAQALAGAIEQAIIDDALQPGDRLGNLEYWQSRSGFARATVNEAMRLLVDRGVAKLRPGRGGGVFVAPYGGLVRLRHTLLSVRGEAAYVADAITIRNALEPLILRDAARFQTPSSMSEVRARLSQLESATADHTDFIHANWALHAAIAQLTPNEMLRTMYTETLRAICEHATGAESDLDDANKHRELRVALHVELVEAIESGDFSRA